MSTATDISRRRFVCRVAGLAAAGFGGWAPSGRPLFAARQGVAPRLAASATKVVFRDVSKKAGVTPMLVCGGPQKKYILEVNGTGCVWFDYNNDGYVDLYIVNGSTIENLLNPAAVKNPPRNYLFRNNGDG